MARIEKCDHCKFGWNNPCGCNRPDKGDPFLLDFSCYEPMTDAQKFQQEAENLTGPKHLKHTRLIGDITTGYRLVDMNNPREAADAYISDFIEDMKKKSVQMKKELKDQPLRISSTTERSQMLGISESTVRINCRKGLYPGATKLNGKWAIPIYRIKMSR